MGILVMGFLLLMPLVIAVGATIGRFVPAPARTAVRVAALCSLAVLVVAAPLALGVGRVAGDPSVLPRPYGWGLLLVLALLWTSALGAIAARRARRRRAVSDSQGRARG